MKASKFREKCIEILEDKSASDWIKRQIVIANNRDVIDMLNEIEVLQDLLMLKFDEAVEHFRKEKSNA